MNFYLQYLESKEHIIARQPWTPEQKTKVQELVNRSPQKASKINWQKKDLKVDEVLNQLQEQSKKRIISSGLTHLIEGKDYDKIVINPRSTAYIPYSHQASAAIASNKVGGCTGKWCTAWSIRNFWDDLRMQDQMIVYIVSPTIDNLDLQKVALVFQLIPLTHSGKPSLSLISAWDSENLRIPLAYDIFDYIDIPDPSQFLQQLKQMSDKIFKRLESHIDTINSYIDNLIISEKNIGEIQKKMLSLKQQGKLNIVDRHTWERIKEKRELFTPEFQNEFQGYLK